DRGGGRRRRRLVTAEGSGAARERSRRVSRQEGRIGDKHPVIVQAGGAAVRPVPHHNRPHRLGSAQIHLPPGHVVQIRGGHRADGEVAVGIAVHGRAGGDGGVSGQRTALGGSLAHRQVAGRGRSTSAEYLYLGQAQDIGAVELHPHIPARTVHRDGGGRTGRGGLMAGNRSRPA